MGIITVIGKVIWWAHHAHLAKHYQWLPTRVYDFGLCLQHREWILSVE